MTDHVNAARTRFPSGLVQPENGFRFAVDSLLLACFAPPTFRVMDLGTGCGVIGLAYLLRHGGQADVLGVDESEQMISCARANAGLLGLMDAFHPLQADVLSFRQTNGIQAGSFDLVLLNPPFRDPGSGRVSRHLEKRAARFEGRAGLGEFLDGAAYALGNQKSLCLVYLAEKVASLVEMLRARRLEPKRLLLVHGHASAPAKIILVEAKKNGRPGLKVEPPLLLYTEAAGGELTEAAGAFCPFLLKK
jgi:tRNA1Val (adenine37-N6)-methyltransferase